MATKDSEALRDPLLIGEITTRVSHTGYDFKSFTRLLNQDSKTVNFVYRGDLQNDFGDRAVLIKLSEPHLASDTSWHIDSLRGFFESAVLFYLKSLFKSQVITKNGANFQLQPVEILSYYKALSKNESFTGVTQVHRYITDAVTLQKLMDSTTLETFTQPVATLLGRWIKAFHDWGTAPEQAELRSKMSGNREARLSKIGIESWALLQKTLQFPELFPYSPQEPGGQGIRDIWRNIYDYTDKELKSEELTLIHGDFWTGNILVQLTGVTRIPRSYNLFIADWELSHVRSPGCDVGKMLADLLRINFFRRQRLVQNMIDCFLEGYGTPEDQMAFEIAVHTGYYLLCLPTTPENWGSGILFRLIVHMGNNLMVHGWKKDRDYFLTGGGKQLNRLFRTPE